MHALKVDTVGLLFQSSCAVTFMGRPLCLVRCRSLTLTRLWWGGMSKQLSSSKYRIYKTKWVHKIPHGKYLVRSQCGIMFIKVNSLCGFRYCLAPCGQCHSMLVEVRKKWIHNCGVYICLSLIVTVFNLLQEVTISGFQLIFLRNSILNLLYFLGLWIELLYIAYIVF